MISFNQPYQSSPDRLTDLKSLFRNTVTSSDRHTVSQFLRDAEEEMKGYNAEMDRLKMAMYMLENKKKGLQKTMNGCRSLLSPIHRLPPEILTLVFSSLCPSNLLTPSSIVPTVSLSWVCGRWREVLLGSASPWTYMQIPFSAWKDKFLKLERLIRLFLDRSQSYSLTLHLTFDESDPNGEQASTAFSMLLQESERWKHVQLWGIPGNLLHQPNSEFCFPSLRVLTLKAYSSFPATQLPISLFKNTPAIRTVAFCSTETILAQHLSLPWDQIRCFALFLFSPRTGLKFMASLPLLRKLEIGGICGQDPPLDSDVHLILSSLTTFTLRVSVQDQLEATLPYMSFPALNSFRLRTSSWWGSTMIITPVTDFLARSACSITSFYLEDSPATVQQIITLLQLMPTITKLSLKEHNRPFITSELLQHFVLDHSRLRFSPILLPLLNNLTLERKTENVSEEDIFAVVASRWIPDSTQASEMGIECLESLNVTLHGVGEGEESEFRSLQCFRAAGLKIRLSRCP